VAAGFGLLALVIFWTAEAAAAQGEEDA